jgi:hypothetical protein
MGTQGYSPMLLVVELLGLLRQRGYVVRDIPSAGAERAAADLLSSMGIEPDEHATGPAISALPLRSGDL